MYAPCAVWYAMGAVLSAVLVPCAQVQGSQGEAGKGTLQIMLGADKEDVPPPRQPGG